MAEVSVGKDCRTTAVKEMFCLQELPEHVSDRMSHKSKEVWKSNFRQYGQILGRDGKSQRRQGEEKSEKSTAAGPMRDAKHIWK